MSEDPASLTSSLESPYAEGPGKMCDEPDSSKQTAESSTFEPERAENSPSSAGGTSGYSLSVYGLACLAAALLLSLLPGFPSMSWVWFGGLLLGGVGFALRVMPSLAKGYPVLEKWPDVLKGEGTIALLVLFTVVKAYQRMSWNLIPLLLILAAVLFVADLFRRRGAPPFTWAQCLDPSLLLSGYRRLVVVGVVTCLSSLHYHWGRLKGSWSGGTDYFYSNGERVEYFNPVKDFTPGPLISGLGREFSIGVQILLVLILVRVCLRRESLHERVVSVMAVIGVGLISVWWGLNRTSFNAVWWFFGGLLAIVIGVITLARGREAGKLDLSQVMDPVFRGMGRMVSRSK